MFYNCIGNHDDMEVVLYIYIYIYPIRVIVISNHIFNRIEDLPFQIFIRLNFILLDMHDWI